MRDEVKGPITGMTDGAAGTLGDGLTAVGVPTGATGLAGDIAEALCGY